MKTRFTLLITLLLLVSLSPLHAQNLPVQTPTPGGLIYGMDAELLFPSAIRFTMALTATANELAFAVLNIRIQGQSTITIPVSIAESATLRDPFTEVVYVWNIPSDAPPAMFSNVTYEWQITRTNDQVVSGQGEFEFTDPRILWETNSSPDSSITFTVPAEDFNLSLVSLRNDMQAAYDLMRTNTGRQPTFHVMLYPTDLLPGCGTNADGETVAVGLLSGTEVACRPAQAAAVYSASGLDVLQIVGTGTENALRFALADLFLERFYNAYWSVNAVPLWFQRGMAVFFLPMNKLNMLEPAQRAARNNRLFTLEDMNAEPTQDADLWRAQSYGMVLYIARQIGVEGLFTLGRNSGTTSFSTAYENAVGQPLSELISGWQRWLFTAAAEDAYSYFPQMETTATPTFTPTPTLPRPTATPTVTNTPTNTPTVTNTGLPELILPTLTPTRTPTRAPATVTPRPAGSVPTPTPTPTPAPAISALSGQAGAFAGLAVILLVLAGLSVIYLRLSSRRS